MHSLQTGWSRESIFSVWIVTGQTWPRGSNLDLELFSALQRLSESRQQFGNLFEIFQAHQFHRRMHVAIGQADQRARNAATRPEDHVGVGARSRGHGFMLE